VKDLAFPELGVLFDTDFSAKRQSFSFTATKTYGSTLTRALRPAGVVVGRASIVVRIVGIRLTPTTMLIMLTVGYPFG